MTNASTQELSRIVLRYATDAVAMAQMRRLPALNVPTDSDQVFADLLNRLDIADQSRQRTPPAH